MLPADGYSDIEKLKQFPDGKIALDQRRNIYLIDKVKTSASQTGPVLVAGSRHFGADVDRDDQFGSSCTTSLPWPSGSIKVANMTLDGNRSFGGDWEVIDENNVKLHMRRCMIIDEFVSVRAG